MTIFAVLHVSQTLIVFSVLLHSIFCCCCFLPLESSTQNNMSLSVESDLRQHWILFTAIQRRKSEIHNWIRLGHTCCFNHSLLFFFYLFHFFCLFSFFFWFTQWNLLMSIRTAHTWQQKIGVFVFVFSSSFQFSLHKSCSAYESQCGDQTHTFDFVDILIKYYIIILEIFMAKQSRVLKSNMQGKYNIMWTFVRFLCVSYILEEKKLHWFEIHTVFFFLRCLDVR